MVPLIEDERGRVPFAVVAVLLLVSSATVATTMAPAPAPDEPAVDVVTERVEAEQQTALRRAVREAASAAARDPVVEPANTTVGRALGDDATFRRSLRLRIYVAAREKFAALQRRRGDVKATVDLPPVDANDASSVRAAIERVELATAGENGTAITVGVQNVTTTVRRGGRVLSERTASPRVTVATPVLALHDRVSAYETRLNAGVTKPGLEQRLTALLNAAGWARGYAQYYGGPIDNVISNRHVEVATNAALLDVQRSTIGRADVKGVDALTEDVGKLAAEEAIAMDGGSSTYLQQAIERTDVTAANDIDGLDVPSRDEPMTVGVNRTAADVFLLMVRKYESDTGFVGYREQFGLASVLEATYSADVRLAARTTARAGGPSSPSSPGEGWERIDTHLEESVSVAPGGRAEAVGTGGEWHALSSFSRRVVTEYERTTTWVKDGRRRETTSTGRETETVSVTLLGRHAPGVPGPDGRIRAVHESGAGPLSGPNLAGVEPAARERLVEERGGRDAVARKAVEGTLETDLETLTGERPSGLREWVYRDLRDLREEVREISVEVDRRAVGTFAVNPPRLLKRKLEARRGELLDASPPYDGVADRARVAARAKYLNLAVRALEQRAASRANRRGALGNALEDADAGSVEDVQQSARAEVESPGDRTSALTGPGGSVGLRVDAAPAYLTLEAVSSEEYPAVDGTTTPLAARNVNLFALPYGDVLNGFLDAILSGPDRTSLAAAAQTLKSRNEHDVSKDVTVGGVRIPVDLGVEGKIDNVEAEIRGTLKAQGVGEDESQRRAIVRAGLSKWDGTADRALAISNGSAATAILTAADERTDLTAVERDRLGLELERVIRDTLETAKARPKAKGVEIVSDAVKSEIGPAIHAAAGQYEDEAVEKLTKGKATTLPSGLPVTPVPGYWYATTNVWHVEVEGEYARFGVRATRGRPSEPGAGLAYARDGGTVTLDVDGDGSEERLGTARRVQFSATVDVVVVVPPGPQGVGDVAGPRDERSSGWPPDGTSAGSP